MPNHVTHVIKAKGNFEECKKFLQDREGENIFDLNTIIPQPRNTYDQYRNKYICNVRDCFVVFDTARNTPKSCRLQLKSMYKDKDIEIIIKYADEDIGHNCGIYIIKGGKIEFIDKTGDKRRARSIILKSKRNKMDRYMTNLSE